MKRREPKWTGIDWWTMALDVLAVVALVMLAARL